MKNLLCFLILSLFLTACNKVVIRDSKAYRLEAMYFSKTIEESNRIVLYRLKTQCCSEGLFNTEAEGCAQDGETYAVTQVRAQHHYNRLMYLAGFDEKDPGSAPEIKTNEVLAEVCK